MGKKHPNEACARVNDEQHLSHTEQAADSAAVTGERTVERFSAVTTPSRRCQYHVPERPFFERSCR